MCNIMYKTISVMIKNKLSFLSFETVSMKSLMKHSFTSSFGTPVSGKVLKVLLILVILTTSHIQVKKLLKLEYCKSIQYRTKWVFF